ncbi:YciI family protein [Taibaiella koreensis]|uniref:YciI family protein n=1 Tax=Taibaiella koreensis TaxID=1268548 RepID=UPI000E59D82F|nr:YciI family protein [Taibaiella koreensis]
MFIVDLQYLAPLETIDAALEAHVRFLDEGYASGYFIASGRKEPRTGGIILAVASDKAQLESFLRDDPFYREGLARYTITEFIAGRKADNAGSLIA